MYMHFHGVTIYSKILKIHVQKNYHGVTAYSKKF